MGGDGGCSLGIISGFRPDRHKLISDPGDAAEPVGEDLKKMSRAESLCKFLIATSPSGAMDRTKLKVHNIICRDSQRG